MADPFSGSDSARSLRADAERAGSSQVQMIRTHEAIARLRRDLTVGMVLNGILVAVALGAILFRGVVNGLEGLIILVMVGGVWLALGYRSVQGSRLAAGSPSLIAEGRLDAAEQQIGQALRSFSLFRAAKLLSIHHLALLRHAQRRWEESAQLCRALLRQRLGSLKGVARQSRLILADALLEMGDVRGAYEALSRLYRQRLPLSEAMSLLAVQLDYEARINAWEQMFHGIAAKVQLAELMPTATAARVQALLALAAKRVGRKDWAHWLRSRVELLADVNELARARPVLWELWQAPAPSQDAEKETEPQPPQQP